MMARVVAVVGAEVAITDLLVARRDSGVDNAIVTQCFGAVTWSDLKKCDFRMPKTAIGS